MCCDVIREHRQAIFGGVHVIMLLVVLLLVVLRQHCNCKFTKGHNLLL
jgi:hypothetical protein